MNPALKIINDRFNHDTLLSVATINQNKPSVRVVDAYYQNGAFYTVTYALSNKMQHIHHNNAVAVCGDWFTANGIGINLG